MRFRFNFDVYVAFNNCFNNMPIAALVAMRIFCCHGGIVRDLNSMSEISDLSRPQKVPNENPIMGQLMWNDPNRENDGWVSSARGVGYQFGKTPVNIRAMYMAVSNTNVQCISRSDKGFILFKIVVPYSAGTAMGLSGALQSGPAGQGTRGRAGWLRVLRQQTLRNHLLGVEILRPVRQCRCHHESRR